MILTALEQLYLRLAADPDADIETPGYSRQKIGFIILLNPDGTLHAIESPSPDPKKPSVQMRVLGGAKPGGQGYNPCFLWDNPGYLLGITQVGKEDGDRAAKCFEAFRQRHLDLRPEIDDPDYAAVCTFLANWTPENGTAYPFLAETTAGFGVFRIVGRERYVHESPAVLAYWKRIQAAAAEEEGIVGQCLVSGTVTRLARLHEPKIKGVRGSQAAGASIVSFNNDAFESYRKKQGFNSPVGEEAAFRYAVALNYLLRRENGRTVELSPDMAVVYWADAPTAMESLFADCITRPAEDPDVRARAQRLLKQIAQMQKPDELGPGETPFYVLGLSPNAARLSVRLWQPTTVEGMAERFRTFFADLAIERSFPDDEPEFPHLWRLLRETVRESKDLPARLAGAVVRGILDGGPLPELWLQSLIGRIRIDRTVNYFRAASLKALLNRNYLPHQELSVSLDPSRPEPAYHLGRLFAVLEQIQDKAQPGLNVTIVDRWFASASATPASAFPILLRLAKHHLSKIDSGGLRFHYNELLREIMNSIDQFPTRAHLSEQGLFMVGYYHQQRELYRKKSDKNDAPEAETAAAAAD